MKVDQFQYGNRELLEMILRAANVREGRWFLIASFQLTVANFGPTPDQQFPGAAVAIQSMGAHRARPDTPVEWVVDAAYLWRNPAPADHPEAVPKRGSLWMTYHAPYLDHAADRSVTKPTEIEITPEMVQVGARLLASYFDQPLDWLTEERAHTIFSEMFAASAALSKVS